MFFLFIFIREYGGVDIGFGNPFIKGKSILINLKFGNVSGVGIGGKIKL
ncbi:MAG: hypothetical protein LBC92_00735 [Rickettsiales bacterium]|nr:hypothetical protein [Rickettsiales bacterium]